MSAYHKNALPPGYELAEYTIESVLGHGGFGITYLARDTTLGANVAIKEYLPHEICTRDGNTAAVLPNPTRDAVRDYHWGLKNFVKEARALARFKHPNIVRVLRFLEANGTAYMVMEYENGKSLADHLKQDGPRLDETTLLRIFIPILNGLHAVHEAEMLHLDIKPENIYIRADGNPMLIDFGSARQAITSAGHVQRIALTHGYAPIEQYPDKGTPGPWTDIYALGASMYRCISGKKPDASLDRYQAVLKYTVDPLMPAAKIGKDRYQRNLLECIDWAIQIYPQDRPRSARELQDALMGKTRPPRKTSEPAKFSSRPDLQPGARPVPVPPRPSRRRARAIVNRGLVTALLAAILVALIVIFREQLEPYWLSLTGQSRPMPSAPPPPPAPRTGSATTAPARGGPTATQNAAASATAAQVSLPLRNVRTLTGNRDWVDSVAFSPDGKSLASAGNDRTIRVWDSATGKLFSTLQGHGSVINAIAFSPDGKWLASAGNDGTVKLWDVNMGTARQTLRGYGNSLYAIAFSHDGKLIAAGGKDRAVFLWAADTGKRVRALEGHSGDVYALVFAPDDRTLISAGADKEIRMWDTASGTEVMRLPRQRDQVLALALSSDGHWLASGDSGGAIRIWDGRSGAALRTVSAPSAVLALAFAPDGGWLAAGSTDSRIYFYETSDGTLLDSASGHQDYVQSLALSADGTLLASGSRDRTIRLWQAN